MSLDVYLMFTDCKHGFYYYFKTALMKKYFLLLTLAASFFLISCKEKEVAEADVPAPVKTAFTTKYPGAAVEKWESETKDGKKVYGADFKIDGKEKEAEFDAEGNFLKEK